MELKEKKILTAFFSHKGENYVNGDIVDLHVGNTAIAAQMLAKIVHSDLFEIRPQKEYSFKYKTCVTQSKSDLDNRLYPDLLEYCDLEEYDIIILGYPNWCGTMPMPVGTFLKTSDLSGKVLIPFCTNEGSGLGHSMEDIRALVPDAILKNGLSLRGSHVYEAEPMLKKWISRELSVI